MTNNERVRQLKLQLEKVCEEIQLLKNENINIEFIITDGKLTRFAAFAPMKWEN